MTYEPENYWNKVLSKDFNLKGVGNNACNEAYNRYEYKLRKLALESLLKKHHIEVGGKNVLDIGCGTGFWIDTFFKDLPKKIVGIDISDKSIEELKSKYNIYNSISFIRADISKPLTITQKFDIVNATDVVFHIVNDSDHITMLENIKNFLAEGGFFIFTEKLNGASSSHVKYRPLTKYKDIGFEIIDVQPMYLTMGEWYHLPPRIMDQVALIMYSIDRVASKLNLLSMNNLKIILAQKRISHICGTTNG